jgi:hypothetical protein
LLRSLLTKGNSGEERKGTTREEREKSENKKKESLCLPWTPLHALSFFSSYFHKPSTTSSYAHPLLRLQLTVQRAEEEKKKKEERRKKVKDERLLSLLPYALSSLYHSLLMHTVQSHSNFRLNNCAVCLSKFNAATTQHNNSDHHSRIATVIGRRRRRRMPLRRLAPFHWKADRASV